MPFRNIGFRTSVQSKSANMNCTKSRRRAFASLVAAITVVDCTSHLHAATVTSTWVGASSNLWSAAANWNPNTNDPSNGNGGISDYDVIINAAGAGDQNPLLNVNATIDV